MRDTRELRTVYRFQRLAAWGAAAIVLALLIGGLRDGDGAYGVWQDAYEEALEALPADSLSGPSGGEVLHGLQEVRIDEAGITDRCVTCHCAVEDPRMLEAPEPVRAHPGRWLRTHPVEIFGCTLCHGGQGRAVELRTSHARDTEVHWPQPLRQTKHLQSACAGCHLTLYSDAEELGEAAVLALGRSVFIREGCLGCHKARGVGGAVGPDLTEQGSKTRHEYDYRHVAGEKTIPNWLREHFIDPETVSPGSQMLALDVPEEELDALVTLTMGLVRPDLPFSYISLDALREFKGERASLQGSSVEALFCSACHGKKGEGKSYEEYRVGVPALGNADFLRLASRNFLLFTLRYGRGLRQMGAWLPRFSGLHDVELDSLIGQIASRLPVRAVFDDALRLNGSAARGAERFERDCSICHGGSGTGGLALPLNRPAMLRSMTPRYVFETLQRGRGNTAMPSWRDIDAGGVADLFALFRSWGGFPGSIAPVALPAGKAADGETRFHYLCSRCHGNEGEGGTGPAIVNRDFLAAADDAFLFRTVSEGRPHTPMFGWSADVPASDRLDPQGVSDIIAFMRNRGASEAEYVYPGATRGVAEKGKQAFAKYCRECHGAQAEGEKAPALNNQEFLSAASNGYLLGTVSLGRGGTRMPSWGRGSTERGILTGQQREDIVAWLRSLQYARLRLKSEPSSR